MDDSNHQAPPIIKFERVGESVGKKVLIELEPFYEGPLRYLLDHCEQIDKTVREVNLDTEQFTKAVRALKLFLQYPIGTVSYEGRQEAPTETREDKGPKSELAVHQRLWQTASRSAPEAPTIHRQSQISKKLEKIDELKSSSDGTAGPPVVIQLDPQVHEALFLLLHHCLRSALEDYASCIEDGFGVDRSLSEFFSAIECTKEFLKVPYGNLNDVMHGPGEPRAANWASDLFARKQAQRSEPRNKSLEDAHNSPYASLEFREFITSPGFKRFVTSQQQREGQFASRVEQQSARHHDHLATPRQDPSKTR